MFTLLVQAFLPLPPLSLLFLLPLLPSSFPRLLSIPKSKNAGDSDSEKEDAELSDIAKVLEKHDPAFMRYQDTPCGWPTISLRR